MSEGSPTPASAVRRPDIQGLRGVAVLLVVAFHAGLPLPGGFVGVDAFFVISGFVIGGLLIRELDDHGRIEFRRFYARRIRRLLPALAALVTVVALTSLFVISPFGEQATTAATGIGTMLLAANVVIYNTTGGYFDAPASSNALLHTWSLSVEEQFYLVVPALMAVAFVIGNRIRAGQGRTGTFLALAAVFGASFALSASSDWVARLGIQKPVDYTFYSSLTRAWEFVAGAVLAFGGDRLARVPSTAALVAGIVGTFLLAVASVAFSATTPFPGTAALLPMIGTLLLIIAGARASGPVSRVLSGRTLVWIGDRSYSWYLWHWPVIVFARTIWPDVDLVPPMAAVASIAPAGVLYRIVENPIRRNPAIHGPRLVGLIAACLVIPIGFAAVATSTGLRIVSPAIATMDAQVRPLHVADVLACRTLNLGRVSNPGCAVNTGSTGVPIYLLGDSQAAMLSEAMIAAAVATGRPLWMADQNSCPFIDAATFRNSRLDRACQQYIQAALGTVVRRPGTIVMAIADAYVLNQQWSLAARPGDAPATSVDAKRSIYQAGLMQLLHTLIATGNTVLILEAIPRFYPNPAATDAVPWFPADCSAIRALTDVSSCGMTQSRSSEAIQQAPVVDATAAAALEAGAAVLDLRPYLCSPRACSTNIGNVWLYRDGAHLTVQETQQLSPILLNAIESGSR